ncbi:MAG: hypothetical protein Q8L07_12180 [Sediminibacterium sp.]|nr:hypothetical protein [Sediminibacterium sp.]
MANLKLENVTTSAHSFVGDMMTKVPAEVTNAMREGRRHINYFNL